MMKYVLTRGGVNFTKKWENDLLAQHFPIEVKNKEGKKIKMLAQIQVRPINLYEIIYPGECEKDMMGMLKPIKSDNEIIKKIMGWLGKFLKLEKASDDWKPYTVPEGKGVSVFVLGNKKDKLQWEKEKSNDLFENEMKPKENL